MSTTTEGTATKKLSASYADFIKATIMKSTTVYDVIDAIKNDTDLASTIKKLRSTDDTDEKGNLKKNLPYFNLGTFENGERKKTKLISTEFMIIDVDKLETSEVLELREKLAKNSNIYFYFTSPSDHGLKVALRFEKEIRDYELYTENYKLYAEWFGNEFDVKTDSTSDASRACYFSSDPELYLNEAAERFEVKEFTTPTQPKPTPSTKGQNASTKKTAKKNIIVSDEEFDLDSEITLANGTVVKVKDTSGHQTIFCPVCDPKKRSNPNSANAFINQNSSEAYYIYCSSESKTFWQKHSDRTGIFETNENTYKKTIKRGKEWAEMKLSSFVIKPKELLIMDDGDSLKCDIVTSKGYKYEDILIENKDWHSKSRLLSAIGHQDCTFLGSDNDVQILCNMVNDNIPIRKTGTKAIGLHDDTWVIDNCNITSKGIVDNPTIIPNEKGADAFYKKIIYPKIDKSEEKELIAGFYDNILKINNLETILPFVSWSFISPLKPKLLEIFGGFPHLFVHGAQGSGKTSTAISQMRLYGYNSDSPYSCTMRLFPMLKLMSSSTSVPIVFDEFKKSDMTDFEMNNMLRFMRKAYTGETESKGRADQTVIDYKITAPMIVMGEWNIIQPAIRERVIASSFTNSVKNNTDMQNAFEKLKSLPLESFMSSYIPFILGEDVDSLIADAKVKIENHFQSISVVPRVKNNLSMMYVGYLLFRGFAKANQIALPNIDIDMVLTNQLEAITGNNTGEVQSSVDHLITGLSTMLSSNHYFTLLNGSHFKILKDDKLAIHFKAILPIFKKWARETDYEIDILDQSSYMKIFDDTDYIIGKDKNTRYGDTKQKKSIWIDVKKALAAGVDLEGFGIEDDTTTDNEELL